MVIYRLTFDPNTIQLPHVSCLMSLVATEMPSYTIHRNVSNVRTILTCKVGVVLTRYRCLNPDLSEEVMNCTLSSVEGTKVKLSVVLIQVGLLSSHTTSGSGQVGVVSVGDCGRRNIQRNLVLKQHTHAHHTHAHTTYHTHTPTPHTTRPHHTPLPRYRTPPRES